MNIDSSGQHEPAELSERKRVEFLLARYPELSLEEEASILHFLRKGSPLEVGLLTSNEETKPKLDQFRSDHARDLAIGTKGVVISIAIVLAFALLCALLWDAGVGG